jgi:hypothetical protein
MERTDQGKIMARHRISSLIGLLVISTLILANTASAQYWFQTGAKGSNATYFNNGFSVSIQTVYQTPRVGTLAFWAGESLSNGAFVQIGYEIINSTGYYSVSCGKTMERRFLTAGRPTWFWEYFEPNGTGLFCGGIGPDGSAGSNGSYNTYSFRSSGGGTWKAYMNNRILGTINLAANSSGPNPPYALGEYAQTNSNAWPMQPVIFKNLGYFAGNTPALLPYGYSFTSYGRGSLTLLPNLYGAQEVGNLTDYFRVGSGLPALNLTTLWQPGYGLRVISNYTNLAGSGNYMAGSKVILSAPQSINIGLGAKAQFLGWAGTGPGSYSGNEISPLITINGNLTETALWKTQLPAESKTGYSALWVLFSLAALLEISMYWAWTKRARAG